MLANVRSPWKPSKWGVLRAMGSPQCILHRALNLRRLRRGWSLNSGSWCRSDPAQAAYVICLPRTVAMIDLIWVLAAAWRTLPGGHCCLAMLRGNACPAGQLIWVGALQRQSCQPTPCLEPRFFKGCMMYEFPSTSKGAPAL